MAMKTGLDWLLVESSKLQDRGQRNCLIRNLTVESAELSDHNVSTSIDMSERLSLIQEYRDLSDKMVQHLLTNVHNIIVVGDYRRQSITFPIDEDY